jgi:hypothetical protein
MWWQLGQWYWLNCDDSTAGGGPAMPSLQSLSHSFGIHFRQVKDVVPNLIQRRHSAGVVQSIHSLLHVIGRKGDVDERAVAATKIVKQQSERIERQFVEIQVQCL